MDLEYQKRCIFLQDFNNNDMTIIKNSNKTWAGETKMTKHKPWYSKMQHVSARFWQKDISKIKNDTYFCIILTTWYHDNQKKTIKPAGI